MGKDIIEKLAELFRMFGPYLESEDIEEITKMGFTVEPFDEMSFEEFTEKELEKILCFNLLALSVDKAFNSPGLDIYVMSIVIEDRSIGNIQFSLNNIYDRC